MSIGLSRPPSRVVLLQCEKLLTFKEFVSLQWAYGRPALFLFMFPFLTSIHGLLDWCGFGESRRNIPCRVDCVLGRHRYLLFFSSKSRRPIGGVSPRLLDDPYTFVVDREAAMTSFGTRFSTRELDMLEYTGYHCILQDK